MEDIEKVIEALDCLSHGGGVCECLKFPCPYGFYGYTDCHKWEIARDALDLLKEQEKEIKALRLLVEWATDCDFGFDQFPEEYERYKDEITDMKYIEGMIHVAKRTLEDHGAFEKGR